MKLFIHIFQRLFILFTIARLIKTFEKIRPIVQKFDFFSFCKNNNFEVQSNLYDELKWKSQILSLIYELADKFECYM